MGQSETAFRVLGVLEVTVDGQPVSLGGPKQRAVLALLLSHVGRPVSCGSMIEEVWGDNAPATADNALQVYVSQIRRAIGSDALQTMPNGYCVPVSQANLDSARFDALADQGHVALLACDYEDATAIFDEALSLWRGEPFSGIETASVRSEAARLSERRLAVTEALVDAELALGKHAEVIARLRTVRATDLHQRERFTGQLMLALYRSGRQAEALEAFAHVRDDLQTTRGLEAGVALHGLYRKILAHDPSLTGAEGRQRPSVPLPATSFVGREADLRRLHDVCRSARLVTITGPGGCGKTRLALEATRSTGDRHPDGVFLAELSRIPEPSLVPFAVAASVGLAQVPGNDLIDLLAAELHNRRILLILDTCEHVLATCEETASRLLDLCPALQIIATSRIALGQKHEQTLALAPLSIPADAGSVPVNELMNYPAVQLLYERAREVRPDLRSDPETIRALAEIAGLLDGVPLGIELAAKQLRQGSLEGLVANLRRQVLALADDRRVGDARERSLRAAIVWSYELLGPTDQAVFDRLSVFAGPFDSDAVATVCSDSPATALATEGLNRLKDASMVVGDDPYRLLDTLRSFAAERLEQVGEADSLRHRHLEHFHGLAERAEAGLLGPEHMVWMSTLNAAYPDLRVATAWALTCGDEEVAGQIIGHLHRYHLAIGHDAQWIAWVDQALEGTLSAEVHVRVLCERAWVALLRGDLDDAEAHFRPACEVSQAEGVARGLASLGLGSTWFYRRADDFAIEELQRAIGFARVEGDHHSQLHALNALGCVYTGAADSRLARQYYRESLDLALDLADPELATYPRANLAWELFADGKDEQARQMLRAVLDTVESLGNAYLVSNGQADLGFIELALGEYGEADGLWRKCLSFATRMGWVEVAARALLGLGSLSAVSGDLPNAHRLWGAADRYHRTLSEKPTWVETTIARRLPEGARPRHDPRWERQWETGESLTLEEAASVVGDQ